MPKLSLPSLLTRRWAHFAMGAAIVLTGVASLPATASASHSQTSIIEDFSDLNTPGATLQVFRELGANTVRVIVNWDMIAPDVKATKKPKFDATNPNAYPQANWAPYDGLVKEANALGLKVDLTVAGGAPRWAEAQAAPASPGVNLATVAWRPNATDYGQFVQAVAKRYPSVHFWAIFNEPNFGQDLGPQATNGSTVASAPDMYRGLVNAGWRALKATGHGHDTILIGELAAEGSEPTRPHRGAPQGNPGNYGQTRPLLFIRDLYCVNAKYQELRGSAAKATGCPTTAAASRKFRSQNPGLFSASGFADHPYDSAGSPVSQGGQKVDYATFQDFGNLGRTLDHVNKVYGSGKHYQIYNTEYGYITNPPNPGNPSPTVAAYYINWAEYLSWKNSRVASYMQYLLKDPGANAGVYNGFSSGLESANGKPKATFAAYQLPVYMPKTTFNAGSNVEVWGDGRSAPFMVTDGAGPQSVAIQLNGAAVDTVKLTGKQNGYFDVHTKSLTKSGSVRLAYTFPKSDPFLPVTELGQTIFSRSFTIKVK